MNDSDFLALLERAREGDDQATAALLDAFEVEVRVMVRARLPKALRRRFETMDFVQAVWQSVFAGRGRGAEFANTGHFRGYLAGVARNKVFEEYRRNTRTRKFDMSREEPLYVRRGGQDAPRELPSMSPTASQVVQAEECWNRLLDGPSPVNAEVIQLRNSGLKLDTIAAKVGVSEKTVRRVLEAAFRRVQGG